MKSSRMIACAASVVAALFVTCLATRPALAAEPLVGTWKMVSWTIEDLETKEQKQPFGPHPLGQLIFTPEMRTSAIFTAAGRQGGSSEADRARSFASMYAAAGKYRVEGSKYYLTVEIASNPAAVGAEQTRTFKIEGDRLTITTDPERSILMGNHMAQAIAVYERVTR
jgi:hypothetical protein